MNDICVICMIVAFRSACRFLYLWGLFFPECGRSGYLSVGEIDKLLDVRLSCKEEEERINEMKQVERQQRQFESTGKK